MSSIPTKQIDGDVAVGRNVSAGGNANIQGNARIGHNLKVEGWLEAKNIKGPFKGLFKTETKLKEVYPAPHNGWYALVGDTVPAQVYIAIGGEWVGQTNADGSPKLGGNATVDTSEYMEEVKDLSDDLDAVKTQVNQNKSDISNLRSAQTLQNNQINNLQTLLPSIAKNAVEGHEAVYHEGLKFVNANLYLDNANGMELAGVISGIKALNDNDPQSEPYYLCDGLIVTFFGEKSRRWEVWQWQGNPYSENPATEWTNPACWKYLLDCLTPWQHDYLDQQLENERLSGYNLSLAVSGLSSEMEMSAKTAVLTATVNYKGSPVTAQIVPYQLPAGNTGVSFGSDGKAQVTVNPPQGSTDGKQVLEFSAVVTVNDSVIGETEFTIFASHNRYAPIKVLNTDTTDAPAVEAIKAATQQFVRATAVGEYTLSTVAGKYLWICVPAFMSVSRITSGGFEVPLVKGQSAIVPYNDGATNISYDLYRFAGAPQSASVKIMIY